MNTKLAATGLTLSLFASLAASAQDTIVKGEVKKIDQAAGKITLNHGPIKNHDMTDENMTMVFHVQIRQCSSRSRSATRSSSRPIARRPESRSRKCRKQNRGVSAA